MTVSEIIAMCQTLVEETYDTPIWVAYINAALDDLTPVSKLLRTKTGIAVTLINGRAVVNLADDADLAKAHEIRAVYFLPGGTNREQLRRLPPENYSIKGWKRDSTSIILQNLGAAQAGDAIDVDYYKCAEHVAASNDKPEIPPEYHNLLVLYACAKSQQKEEELSDKNDFYAEYLQAKQAYALDRLQAMEPYSLRRAARLAVSVGGM